MQHIPGAKFSLTQPSHTTLDGLMRPRKIMQHIPGAKFSLTQPSHTTLTQDTLVHYMSLNQIVKSCVSGSCLNDVWVYAGSQHIADVYLEVDEPVMAHTFRADARQN